MSHTFFAYERSFVSKILDDGLVLVVQMNEGEVENIISIDLAKGDKPKVQKIHKRNQEAFTDLFTAPHQNVRGFASQVVKNSVVRGEGCVSLSEYTLKIKGKNYEVHDEKKSTVCAFESDRGSACSIVYVCGNNFLVSNYGDVCSVIFGKIK